MKLKMMSKLEKQMKIQKIGIMESKNSYEKALEMKMKIHHYQLKEKKKVKNLDQEAVYKKV